MNSVLSSPVVGFTANWVQIIWGTCALGATIFAWYLNKKREEKRREIEIALLIQKFEAMEKRLDKEFGGNSGGVRERINAMDAKLDKNTELTLETAQGLALLTGRFDEHAKVS